MADSRSRSTAFGWLPDVRRRTMRERIDALKAKSIRFGIGVAVLIGIGLVADTALLAYHLDRDIDSQMDRAQVAADAEEMSIELSKVSASMFRYGASTGHTAFVFTNPRNDLGLQYRAIGRLVDRLDGLAKLPQDSTAYQSGLDDARGIIREMPRLEYGVLWMQRWWVIVPLGIAVLVCC
jgi:hypothetical protein